MAPHPPHFNSTPFYDRFHFKNIFSLGLAPGPPRVMVLKYLSVCLCVCVCAPPSPIHTKRYSPLRGLTSSSCGGLQPLAKAFFPLRAKTEFFTPFVLILSNFWCSVMTSIIFSSNLSNFEKNKTLKNLERKKSKLSKNRVFFNPNFLKYAI